MTLRREKLLVSLAIQSIVLLVFFWIEATTGSAVRPAPAWLVTLVDRQVPFISGAVWLYVSWYGAPVVLLMLSRREFRRASAAVLVGFLLCALAYTVLPITMDRPGVDGDGAAGALLRAVYAVDKPRNIFPSFHATVCAVLALVMPAVGWRRVALLLWTAAICISCVLTKQHYVLDVVAGLLVGTVAVATVDATRNWFAQTVSPTRYTVRPVRSETAE